MLRILQLAIPIILGQLAGVMMGIIDAVMIGRGLGTEGLAGLGFAISVTQIPTLPGFGIAAAAVVLMSRAFGEGRIARSRHYVKYCHRLALLFGICIASGLTFVAHKLPEWNYWQQPADAVSLALPYLILFSWSFVPLLAGVCFRAWHEAQNKPWLPLIIFCCTALLNALLNYLFIYGKWGFPAWGMTGAGLGTLISNTVYYGVMRYHYEKQSRQSEAFKNCPSHEWRDVLKTSLPICFQIGFEVWAFAITALLVGLIGNVALAAHHLTLQIATFSFMIPLGYSMACSILHGQAIGRKDYAQVRRIRKAGLLTTLLWMSLVIGVIGTQHTAIPHFFCQDTAVIALCSQLLLIMACFQLFDGLQVVAAGMLRGLGDVKTPAVIVMGCYWVAGLPLGVWLAFSKDWGAVGIWVGLALGLCIAAISLNLRLHHIIGKMPLKD
jgi:MATE family multidrug resistance protein